MYVQFVKELIINKVNCKKSYKPVIICVFEINVPAHWNSNFNLTKKIAATHGHWPGDAFSPPAMRGLTGSILLRPHARLLCSLFGGAGLTFGTFGPICGGCKGSLRSIIDRDGCIFPTPFQLLLLLNSGCLLRAFPGG